MEKEYGNRRNEEDLKKVTDSLNALTYQLEDQPDFLGNAEELAMMQAAERRYIDGYPVMSDEEWGFFKNKFHYHESLVSVAPSGRSWIKMQAPLPSMLKASTLDELKAFLDTFDQDEIFLVEPKFDGLTANLVYGLDDAKNIYHLVHITSRGNGRYGLQIWDHALDGVKLNGVPQSISYDIVQKIYGFLPETLEIRGEALIPKTKRNVERYLPDGLKTEDMIPGMEPVVWRSIVSGIFNRKVPNNLDGVLLYLYGKNVAELMDGKSTLPVEPLPDARLIASLGNDTHRFNRTSKLEIINSGKQIKIMHSDGETCIFDAPAEEITMIAYSMSIDGANLDKPEIMRTIPGLLYANEVKTLDGEKTHFYLETSNHDKILQLVCDFYGCDMDGKRNFDKIRWRNKHEFALDGMVIKRKNSSAESQGMDIRNSISNSSKLVIPKYPKDQIAVKLASEIVTVKLQTIEKTTTDLKNVTLQGMLDKAYQTESGAWISSINLHNPNWLEANSWIHEGGEYRMVLAMDIIPVLLPPLSMDDSSNLSIQDADLGKERQ